MKTIKTTYLVMEETEANKCPHCNHAFVVNLYTESRDELGKKYIELFVKSACISFCPMCGKESLRRDSKSKE